MNNSVLYVDVDGVLLCGSLSKQYHRLRKMGLERKEAIDKIDKQIKECDRLGINHELLKHLSHRKINGAKLILWTNRSECVKEATKRQLGNYWHLFDEHLFRNGEKLNDRLSGIVIDDDKRHKVCGLFGFEHVDWFCCHDLSCVQNN